MTKSGRLRAVFLSPASAAHIVHEPRPHCTHTTHNVLLSGVLCKGIERERGEKEAQKKEGRRRFFSPLFVGAATAMNLMYHSLFFSFFLFFLTCMIITTLAVVFSTLRLFLSFPLSVREALLHAIAIYTICWEASCREE